MRSFVIFAVLAVAVHARPEPPSGYAYNAPAPAPAPVQSFSQGFSGASNSYLAPAIGNGGGSYSNGVASSGSFSNGGGSSFSNGGGSFASGGASSSSFGNGGGASFGNGGGASFGNGGGSFASGGASSSSFGNGGFSNGGNGGFGGGASFGQADAGSQGTIVQKHIYVHVPPPEEEAQNAATAQQFSQPRKHYKIIFIKAPSAPSISQQIAAVQAQNEEKTLIYVLVKKPEDIDIPAAPQPAAIPVSKPEVYFIKYKTQKEAAGAGAGSFAGSSAGSSAGGFSGSLGVGDGGFSSGNGGFSGSSAGSSAGGFSSGSGNGGFSGSSAGSSAGGFSSGGFDIPAPNPQATYGAPIKK